MTRDERWCTPLEAAHRLGVPLTTVERLVLRGVLPVVRKGRSLRMDVAVVEDYACRRRGCGIR